MHFGAVFLNKAHSAVLNRGKVGPAQHHAHLVSGHCQLDRQNATDGAGANNANSHVFSLLMKVDFRVPMPSMMTSTTVPGRMGKTPSEVPQAITSPGQSVISCDSA